MRKGNIQVNSENILPVIKKWLYSDKDIFLRELVSNACDAVYKLQRLAQMGEAEKDGSPAKVTVTLDKENRVLTVEDNGVGMTGDEVEKYITQVAFSGAQEFLEKYSDKTDAEGGIIGHFGLGFYSAFMVSDTVEIETRSWQPDAKPVRWVSQGDTGYEIGEGSRAARGTAVILHISEEESEFLEEFRIREMLRKYCLFMPVEIYFNPKEGEENKPVNDPSPLWLKAPKDCTKEEYEQFYSKLFLDFNPPLFWIHLNVDYPFNLKGILYFPRQSNKVEVMPGEIKLYSNQVYIADNIKEVVPEFLMLLKGVIDCPDLPLNVSRSFLQNDADVQKISKHIGKKVSDKLHEIFTNERETYNGYWDDISPFIKFGCIRDDGFYDRVKDILLLKSVEGGYLTLGEFPKTEDKKIFYVSDEAVQAQYIRLFKEQGMNAAILSHAIDPHFISFLEFKDHETKFSRIDSDIGEGLKNGDAGDGAQALTDRFTALLEDDKLTIRAEKLKNADTPAVMLLSEEARRMQEMSKMYGGAPFDIPAPEETLVVNLENIVAQSVLKLGDDKAKLVAGQVLDLARISHKALGAEEMAAFIGRSVEILRLVSEN